MPVTQGLESLLCAMIGNLCHWVGQAVESISRGTWRLESAPGVRVATYGQSVKSQLAARRALTRGRTTAACAPRRARAPPRAARARLPLPGPVACRPCRLYRRLLPPRACAAGLALMSARSERCTVASAKAQPQRFAANSQHTANSQALKQASRPARSPSHRRPLPRHRRRRRPLRRRSCRRHGAAGGRR